MMLHTLSVVLNKIIDLLKYSKNIMPNTGKFILEATLSVKYVK